jgi:hypothetical protein
VGDQTVCWYKLVDLCSNVILWYKEDKCKWTLNSSGVFSIHSMYVIFKARQVSCPFKKIWCLNGKSLLVVSLYESILTRNVFLHGQ